MRKQYESNGTNEVSISDQEYNRINIWYIKSDGCLSIKVLRNDPKSKRFITTDSTYRHCDAKEIPKDFLEELKDSVKSFNDYCESIKYNYRLELTDPDLLNLVIKYLDPTDDIVDEVPKLEIR